MRPELCLDEDDSAPLSTSLFFLPLLLLRGGASCALLSCSSLEFVLALVFWTFEGSRFSVLDSETLLLLSVGSPSLSSFINKKKMPLKRLFLKIVKDKQKYQEEGDDEDEGDDGGVFEEEQE